MLNPGEILDKKYQIIRILGRGGMGTVYLCKNNRLGNLWAVKEVNSKWKDKTDFLAEPNILKNLSHIGIIRIIDIFYESENLYIVEDYIEGKTLKEYVTENGPMDSELVTDISLQLCSILDYLHSLNPPIVYRDLKPSNIMIKPNNKIVLIDFGIARSYKEGQEGDTMILGSMGYIAPEQLVNTQSNAKTDIYSLGATMFFMLTGKAISVTAELMDQKNYPDNVVKSLVKTIQKASSIEPENRYRDIKMMVLDLNAIIADREYTKTMFMNSNEADTVATKAALLGQKKPRKRIKLIIIAVLACIIALAIFLTAFMSNKASDKKASEGTAPKTAEETKPKVEPAKEVIEKDTIVKGIINLKNPVGASNVKGKGKDKNSNLPEQFVLNPASAIYNSKLSISLTSIQVMDKEVVAILSIENTADDALKLDVNRTYMVNAKNESVRGYSLNSASMISIPKSPTKQEFKLYFKEFQFEEGPFTLKTVLSSAADKEINLIADVIK